MSSEKSFKTRVRDVIMQNAVPFYNTFVMYDYVLFSDAFENNEYYIISACADNYKHLTGVNSDLSANEFFTKCINKTLKEEDFDFIKKGQDEKEVKGSVRRKINVLTNINNMFDGSIIVEEDFEKNYVRCSFAVADTICTLGFINVGTARPNTLLKNNVLDTLKSKPLELVLRRKRGDNEFKEVILGDKSAFEKFANLINRINEKGK